MLKHLLLPLDGSELAEKALEYVDKLVGSGSKITLLMAIDPPEAMAYSTYGAQVATAGPVIEQSLLNYSAVAENMMDHGKNYLAKKTEALQKAGYTVQTLIDYGYAADMIIDTAEKEQVDAIVICTHGRSGLSRWILGSVTQKILGAAVCPVFVIPPDRNTAD
jgi:nucleotide-binding universal stress UspA family protein